MIRISQADKVSILDDVIEHLKQLQAQVQFMSLRANLPQQMMMAQLPPPQSVLSIQQQQQQQQQHQQQQQQQQFQMSFLATMARMGMGSSGNAYGGLVPHPPPPPPPPPLMVPSMANRDCTNGSSAPLNDPYSVFLAQVKTAFNCFRERCFGFIQISELTVFGHSDAVNEYGSLQQNGCSDL